MITAVVPGAVLGYVDMPKPKKSREIWPEDEPSLITARVQERMRTVDFDDLREELRQLTIGLEPINLPTDEEWQLILYMESIGQTWGSGHPYWWGHEYPSTNDYRARVKEFNKEIERSGIHDWARGVMIREGCPVWVVSKAIEEQKLSSALIDAWATLNILMGRLFELREFQVSASKVHRKTVASAARNARLGQHIWYAHWVLKHAPHLEDDRATADEGIQILCCEIVSKSRELPQEWKWDRKWFRKLLGGSGNDLIDRLTRMNAERLKRLAGHKKITADLLPPLDAAAYPTAKDTSSSHP
jgi:hypothetical protein